MPSKYLKRDFKANHFYHIFNRGAYKNNIFLDNQDYNTFTSILSYYLKFPLAKHFSYHKLAINPYVKVTNLYIDSVHLISFCLMPNHFHLLLKETPLATKQTGISNLMRRVMIAYSMYYQDKHQHSGALFQGRYKNVEIETHEQLLYISKYIHRNPTKIINRFQALKSYSYSSYLAFIGNTQNTKWLHPEEILKLDYYKNSKKPQKDYQKFVQESDHIPKTLLSLTLDDSM
jgi:putative transposase